MRHGWCEEGLTPLLPATDYGICKNALRALFEAYCARSGIGGAWGRLFHLYGPYEHPARLVSSVATTLLRGEDAGCSHGRQWRDFLHVADAADALVALLDSEVCGAVNIGSGAPVSIGEVARKLALLAACPQRLQLGARPAPEGEPPVLLPATRRLRQEVGWQPRYDLAGGLQQTLDWWRNQA
jgi:nucleoside-diphosphate-sugar epimerase